MIYVIWLGQLSRARMRAGLIHPGGRAPLFVPRSGAVETRLTYLMARALANDSSRLKKLVLNRNLYGSNVIREPYSWPANARAFAPCMAEMTQHVRP